jgi:hypothetical protein
MRERSPCDDWTGTHALTPPLTANAQPAHVCAFTARPVCGATPSCDRGPEVSAPSGDRIVSVCLTRLVGEPTGTLSPVLQTNEMQGGGISFCGHCGAKLRPQITRRGHPTRGTGDPAPGCVIVPRP